MIEGIPLEQGVYYNDGEWIVSDRVGELLWKGKPAPAGCNLLHRHGSDGALRVARMYVWDDGLKESVLECRVCGAPPPEEAKLKAYFFGFKPVRIRVYTTDGSRRIDRDGNET